MGIDATTVGLMRRFGVTGHGASFGYPDFIDRSTGRNVKHRSEPVFRQIGVSVDVYDVGKLRGFEILIDLNEPTPLNLMGKYDFIINPGTYDHVFNIANAMTVGYKMTKPGGLGFHHGTIADRKHGYWTFTEKTWPEFCKMNGRLLFFEASVDRYYAVTENGETSSVHWPQENNVR